MLTSIHIMSGDIDGSFKRSGRPWPDHTDLAIWKRFWHKLIFNRPIHSQNTVRRAGGLQTFTVPLAHVCCILKQFCSPFCCSVPQYISMSSIKDSLTATAVQDRVNELLLSSGITYKEYVLGFSFVVYGLETYLRFEIDQLLKMWQCNKHL